MGFLIVLPALFPAALWTVAVLGRTSLAGVSFRWLATFVLAVSAVTAWTWLAGGRRRPALRAAALLPAALVAGGVLGAIYGSETAYHRFVNEPLTKGLALPATVLLVLAAPALAAGRGFAQVLSRHQRPVAALALGGVGLCQSLSLLNVATDDLIRYWAVADALLLGAGYPVTEGVPRGAEFYLVDQPLYPALIIPAFRLLGHRYLALHLPLILANIALPLVFYGLARAVGRDRLVALGLAVVVLCFPYYQVYALGAADPEPLWAVECGLLLLLALRVTTPRPEAPAGRASLWEWGCLGLAGAAAAMTRPEGTLYAGLAMLGLGLHFGRRCGLRERGWWLAGVVCAVPVALFTLFLWREFGVLSPAGWQRIAGLSYLLPNLRIAVERNLPHYAEVAGLPAPALTGIALAGVLLGAAALGLLRLWRRSPGVRFVPVALGINLAVILLTPPTFAGDVMSPQTFLRHSSVLFPWLVPALALVLPAHPRRPAIAAVAFGVVLLAELSVLASVTARDQAQQAVILTRDPYVLATDLWRAQDPLPWLTFTPGPGGTRVIDPRFDYLAFRRGLFAAVRPYDQHVENAGQAYILASAVCGLGGLGATAAAGLAYAAHDERKASAAAAMV